MLANNGNTYSVQVSDDIGLITSETVSLTVNEAPPPSTTVVIAEGTVDASRGVGPRFVRLDFDALATAEHTISVSWDNDADVRFLVNNLDKENLSPTIRGNNPGTWTGELDTNTSYYIGLWSVRGVANYTVTVETNSIIPLSISSEPADLTVIENDDAEFSVVATSSGSISYQWYFNDTELPGATQDTLTLTNVVSDDAGTYMVMVFDDNNFSTFASAELNVIEPALLEIINQPAGLAVIEGDDASFMVRASGAGALSYQWFVDSVAIPGATDSSFTVTAAEQGESGSIYTVEVSDSTGSIILSDDAVLTVNPLETDDLPVTIVNLGEGTLDSEKNGNPRFLRLEFESLAAAEHTITVTWDGDADIRFVPNESDGTNLSEHIIGASPSTWTGVLEADTAYYVGLWSFEGVANYTVTIEASIDLDITSQPTDLTVAAGDEATFSVEAAGSGILTYQWFVDGEPIAGENASSLTVFAESDVDDGRQYSVEVSNGADTIASTAATLGVTALEVSPLYSQEADVNTWILDGPAPTLDFNVSNASAGWGRVLLRLDDVLLIGGDFEGIRPSLGGQLVDRPWLAALDAVTGQPVSTFQVPVEVNSVVRSLVLSPGGDKVYVGGDFGLLALDAQTGALEFAVDLRQSTNPGLVFDIAVSDAYMYIGGDFSHVRSMFQRNIARISHNGSVDTSWRPDVRGGTRSGREAPVQAVTLSPAGDVVYIGGNFASINDTNVPKSNRGTNVSMLVVESGESAAVRPEMFTPVVYNNKPVKVRDIAVTEDYVIIAWGGPNHLGFHDHDGTRLKQYDGTGDTQALKVVGDLVYVGHHGKFFGTLENPIPAESVESIDPEIVVPYKFHSFRIDDQSFPYQQAWQINGFFGVWGIAVADDSIWLSGQMIRAGSNDRAIDGLVRFPAISPGE